MPDRHSRRRALLICIAIAIVAFLIGWLLPVPAAADERRDGVTRQVRERLPGWEIANLSEITEWGWAVAVRCDEAAIDFWLRRDARPVGGLSWDDYWVVAANRGSYELLAQITEQIDTWLIWRAEPWVEQRLPCDSVAIRPG